MNNFSNYGGAQQPLGGYPFVAQQSQSMPMNTANMRQPQWTNPLGAQRIKEKLESGSGAPKLAITAEEVEQALCTHRFNGQMMFYDINDGTGKVRCKICGEEFIPVDNADIKDVEEATQSLLNVLNTTKIAWLDVPDKVAQEYFQIIAIIKKVPKLYEIAMGNFSQYNNYQLPNMSGQVNGFNSLYQLLGPQMPMMQQQMQQPMNNYNYGMQYDQFGNPINAVPPMNNYNYAAQQMQSAAPGGSNPFIAGGASTMPPMNQNVAQQQQSNQAQAPSGNGDQVTKQLHL
jgi:hypothetical protein